MTTLTKFSLMPPELNTDDLANAVADGVPVMDTLEQAWSSVSAYGQSVKDSLKAVKITITVEEYDEN